MEYGEPRLDDLRWSSTLKWLEICNLESKDGNLVSISCCGCVAICGKRIETHHLKHRLRKHILPPKSQNP